MSLRAVQAQAVQQLQALNLQQWSIRQFFATAETLCTASGRSNVYSSLCSTQHVMTVGQPSSTKAHIQPPLSMGSAAHEHQQQFSFSMPLTAKSDPRFNTPSPSSSMSECCHVDRSRITPASASTKSAKRKAAEALLAARYGSCNAAVSAAVSLPTATPPSQLQNKRHRSSLASAIEKLENTGGTASTAAEQSSSLSWSAAAAATAAASRADRQKPQLAKLQQVLQQLHGQQPRSSAQLLQHSQQQPCLHLPQQGDVQDVAFNAAAAAISAAAVQSGSHLAGQQQHVQVQACEHSCSHSLANGWCHSQVQLPHVDWGRVLDADLANAPSFKVAQGYERCTLPDGLQVLVVENQAYLNNALQQLRNSMRDPIIAIDLEWRPEFGRRFTPVAMIQLASSKVAVLIRTCRMNYRLPAVLKDFLKDNKVSLVGFSWTSSDEPKMQSTFGLGCRDFGRFLDLQQVAQGLGYSGFGLARLTRHVLGLHMPKSKKISMSNWEAAALSKQQVKYAALDVLVAGQVFRALRLWHSSPSLCEVCHFNLGSTCTGSSDGYICTCGKSFKDIKGYLQHCATAGHDAKWAECSGCGCTRQLPWPSGGAAAENSSSDLAKCDVADDEQQQQ